MKRRSFLASVAAVLGLGWLVKPQVRGYETTPAIDPFPGRKCVAGNVQADCLPGRMADVEVQKWTGAEFVSTGKQIPVTNLLHRTVKTDEFVFCTRNSHNHEFVIDPGHQPEWCLVAAEC